jgi:hypothetical protein
VYLVENRTPIPIPYPIFPSAIHKFPKPGTNQTPACRIGTPCVTRRYYAFSAITFTSLYPPTTCQHLLQNPFPKRYPRPRESKHILKMLIMQLAPPQMYVLMPRILLPQLWTIRFRNTFPCLCFSLLGNLQ